MARLRLDTMAGRWLAGRASRLLALLLERSWGRAERLFVAGCLVYTAVAQFATNSLRQAVGDATLFAYGGRLIEAGYVPYRDFWDNKPPLIFYIDALGYWLFGNTWLGPTALQAMVFLLTVLAFAWLARRLIPHAPLGRAAMLGLVTLGLNLPVFMMDGANLTETYLLLLVAVSLGLLDPLNPRVRARSWLCAGAVAGLAFLLRPNAASLGAVALASLALRSGLLASFPPSTLLRYLGAYVAGGMAPLVLATLYFAAHGVAREMWFATVTYNLTAYDELFLLRPSLLEPHRYYMFQDDFGVSAMLVAGAWGALFLLARYASAPARVGRVKLAALCLAVTWLALDLALVLATGHPYAHYVLMLVPSAAYLGSMLFDLELLGRARPGWGRRIEMLGRLVVLAGTTLALWPLARDMPAQIAAGMRRAAWWEPTLDQEVALWVRAVAEESDPVMTLGHFHGHMMYLGNPPAVALLSTFHLKSHYGAERWAPQYLRVLRERAPKAVVITDGYWNPFVSRRGASFTRPPDQYREAIEVELLRRYQRVAPELPHRMLLIRKDLPVPTAALVYSRYVPESMFWF